LDYCLKEECQQRCMRRVALAAVGVNKAADYIMKAEEVAVPPAPPPLAPVDADEAVALRARRPPPSPPIRFKSAPERLRDAEAALDSALQRSYERFSRGEVTAKEMNQDRERLIRSFNQRVMNENIRYRSMLRKLP
jgi:hypothetical protein